MSSTAPPGLFDLSGKVALITGSTRGIGLSIAEEMARAGAEVIISSDEIAACSTVAAKFRDAGLKATGIPCDVGSRTALETLVSEALAHHSRIDILVCNAGIQPPHGPLSERTDEDWDATLTVNLRSALWL